LLAELDGFDPTSGVILIGATNRPEVLDPALLRPGRFDRQVLVDRPDRLGRLQILKVHVAKVRLADGVDLDQIAGLTTGFTGADLANLVNEAAIVATRRKADAVTLDDFTAAIERIVAGLEKKSRVLRCLRGPGRSRTSSVATAGCGPSPTRATAASYSSSIRSASPSGQTTSSWCSRRPRHYNRARIRRPYRTVPRNDATIERQSARWGGTRSTQLINCAVAQSACGLRRHSGGGLRRQWASQLRREQPIGMRAGTSPMGGKAYCGLAME
jgi:hypothetical protein